MKKKLLAYVCMIACIFGLVACGSGGEPAGNGQDGVEAAKENMENTKVEIAKNTADVIINFFAGYLCNGVPFAVREQDITANTQYLLETNEELEYLCSQSGIMVDGGAVATGVQSINSGMETIGGIKEFGEKKVKIDGKQIIVEVPVTGEKQDAVIEIVFSNDIFMRMKSVAFNPTASMGQLMAKAGLNTLIGMGTVFIVLILISLIISCFRFISKAQDAAAKRKAAGKDGGADNAVAQIAAREEAEDVTDDCELVAVIAAAIAASRGSASAEGFVVRSVIRR